MVTKRNQRKYYDWRDKVFERDCYTCARCGTMKNLQAHHIKSYSRYPSLRLVVRNGIVLCKKCHGKTDNYGTQDRVVDRDSVAVMIRNVPKEDYIRFRGAILNKHGLSVASWFRKNIDKELKSK